MTKQNGFAALILMAALILIGFSVGWISAYERAAKECKLIGAFYTGDTTYKCEVKT